MKDTLALHQGYRNVPTRKRWNRRKIDTILPFSFEDKTPFTQATRVSLIFTFASYGPGWTEPWDFFLYSFSLFFFFFFSFLLLYINSTSASLVASLHSRTLYNSFQRGAWYNLWESTYEVAYRAGIGKTLSIIYERSSSSLEWRYGYVLKTAQ